VKSHTTMAAAATLLPVGTPAPAPITWLARIVDWSIVLIGGMMATLVFANVILHNVFKGDIAWTTEFCELLMVWVTFLGGAAATRRGAHMVVGELVGCLSGLARRYADAAIQVVVLVTLGLLVWHGIGIADAGRMSQLTVLGWPMVSQYAALPVASAITMVFVFWDLVEILRGRTHDVRYGKGHP
jgi:TRAP-type C4-dicarboxylate transport system permease small subunit